MRTRTRIRTRTKQPVQVQQVQPVQHLLVISQWNAFAFAVLIFSITNFTHHQQQHQQHQQHQHQQQQYNSLNLACAFSSTAPPTRQRSRIYTSSGTSTSSASSASGISSAIQTVLLKHSRNYSKRTIMSASSILHVDDDLLPQWMNKERTKVLTTPDITQPKLLVQQQQHCVYYWMQRDIRTVDNWALLFAQHLAQSMNIPLKVIYVLPCPYKKYTIDTQDDSSSSSSSSSSSPSLPPKANEIQMTERHGSFLLGGLKIVHDELRDKNVSLHILRPESHLDVGRLVYEFVTGGTSTDTDIDGDGDDNDNNDNGNWVASAVVCDMSPLRQYREWMEDQAAPLLKECGIPLYQVDAHNIVPVWFASPKREVGARTLRPKINKLLPEFLTHFPDFEGNQHMNNIQSTAAIAASSSSSSNNNNNNNDDDDGKWDDYKSYLNLDQSVPSIPWAQPGRHPAMKRFEEFCTSQTQGLKNFDTLRNDPNYDQVCSNLSPWVNYGMVSFQRLALDVRALKKHPNGTASYIEEGIVRRELSDNFVYYSREDYDELLTAAGWAQETLQVHTDDEREYVYSLEELENSRTHDDLWNAAQVQLVKEGHMHGFLRMYWAKKILEWTESPEIALRTAQYFNDRFALDGNDPNGFTGVGWSIMGIHDMGWKERPIFGKIRFMNYAGCKRKFKVDTFVAKYSNNSKVKTKAKTKSQVKSTSASKVKKPTTSTVRKASTTTAAAATTTTTTRSTRATTKKRKAPTPRKSSAFDRLQKKLNKR